MLRNPSNWAYGIVPTDPFPRHPELKTRMLPPEWSVLYGATEKRAETNSKKIKSGALDPVTCAKNNDFSISKKNTKKENSDELEKFRQVINSVIRDESKHLQKSDVFKHTKNKQTMS